MLGKIDSYQLSTLYTSVAFFANSVYEVFLHQRDIADQPLSRDVILVSLYASVISYFLAFIKSRRLKVATSITSASMWIMRLICGIIISSYMGIVDRDPASLVYWIVSFLGAAFGSWSIVGQYRQHKEHVDHKSRELEPVKLRFVA